MREQCRQIDPQALNALRNFTKRRSKAKAVWQARIVLAFFAGQAYRPISQRFGCSQATIARWVKRFRAEEIEGLYDRPRKLPVGPRQKLLAVWLPQVVHQSPRCLSVPQDRWTLQALQDLCVRQTGQRPSLETMRLALKRFGYSWKRAKRTVTSPDPQYQRKKGQ